MAGRHHSKRIVLFNHKGGVGKTTLTINIAFSLASLGKKVLVVDSDPQCNLTEYLVEESVVSDYLNNSDTPQGSTIWTALRPVVYAEGAYKFVPPVEVSDNLFLLPGDLKLSLYEEDIYPSWTNAVQMKIKGYNAITSISNLVNDICVENKIDFVFFDCGPNIGFLNRVIFLDCDYFIIPAACDNFSLRAISTLGKTLVGWIDTWDVISRLAPTQLPLLPGKPALLGYIPQRFSIYRGQPSTVPKSKIPQIEKRILSDIFQPMKKYDSSLVRNRSVLQKLGEIQDFRTSAAEAQMQGVPISSIVETAKNVFDNIARKIISSTAK